MNAKILFEELKKLNFNVNDSYESTWSDNIGISELLFSALAGENESIVAQYIQPKNEGCYSEMGLAENLRLLASSQYYVKLADGSFSAPSRRQEDLNPPIICVANVESIHSENVHSEGGAHWVSWVLLPKIHECADGKIVDHEKYRFFFFDGLNQYSRPKKFIEMLTTGTDYWLLVDDEKDKQDSGKWCHFIVDKFCNANELEVIDCSQLGYGSQGNTSDCGWWAAYYALMTVYTGGIEFLNPIKGKKLSASPLRQIMAIEETPAALKQKKLKKKNHAVYANEEKLKNMESLYQAGQQKSSQENTAGQRQYTHKVFSVVDIYQYFRIEKISELTQREALILAQFEKNEQDFRRQCTTFEQRDRDFERLQLQKTQLVEQEQHLKAQITAFENMLFGNQKTDQKKQSAADNKKMPSDFDEGSLDRMFDDFCGQSTLGSIREQAEKEALSKKIRSGKNVAKLKRQRQLEIKKKWQEAIDRCTAEGLRLESCVSSEQQMIDDAKSIIFTMKNKIKTALGDIEKKNKEKAAKQDEIKKERDNLVDLESTLQKDLSKMLKEVTDEYDGKINSVNKQIKDLQDKSNDAFNDARDHYYGDQAKLKSRYEHDSNEAKGELKSLLQQLNARGVEYYYASANWQHYAVKKCKVSGDAAGAHRVNHRCGKCGGVKDLYDNLKRVVIDLRDNQVPKKRREIRSIEEKYKDDKKDKELSYDGKVAIITEENAKRSKEIQKKNEKITKHEQNKQKKINKRSQELTSTYNDDCLVVRNKIENLENELLEIKNAITDLNKNIDQSNVTIVTNEGVISRSENEITSLKKRIQDNKKNLQLFKKGLDNCEVIELESVSSENPVGKTGEHGDELLKNQWQIKQDEIDYVHKQIIEKQKQLKEIQSQIVQISTKIHTLSRSHEISLMSPMIRSILCCHLDIVQLLLKMGVRVNEQDSFQRTLLHFAVQNMNTKNVDSSVLIVKELLERGAKLDACDGQGRSVYDCSQSAHMKMILLQTALNVFCANKNVNGICYVLDLMDRLDELLLSDSKNENTSPFKQTKKIVPFEERCKILTSQSSFFWGLLSAKDNPKTKRTLLVRKLQGN